MIGRRSAVTRSLFYEFDLDAVAPQTHLRRHVCEQAAKANKRVQFVYADTAYGTGKFFGWQVLRFGGSSVGWFASASRRTFPSGSKASGATVFLAAPTSGSTKRATSIFFRRQDPGDQDPGDDGAAERADPLMSMRGSSRAAGANRSAPAAPSTQAFGKQAPRNAPEDACSHAPVLRSAV